MPPRDKFRKSGKKLKKVMEASFQTCGEHFGQPDLIEDYDEDLLHSLTPLQTAAISTLWETLDDLLQGGAPYGGVTEVSGAAGSGKTQLAYQLLVSQRLSQVSRFSKGCLDSDSAIYINTENSFYAKRLEEVARAQLQRGGHHTVVEELPPLLAGIHVFSLIEMEELLLLVDLLDQLVTLHKLVIIDSISAPFRGLDSDSFARLGCILQVMSKLVQLSVTQNIAVVVTNRAKKSFSGVNAAAATPTLGDYFSHYPLVRVALSSMPCDAGIRRVATILKPSTITIKQAKFLITIDGIIDDDGTQLLSPILDS